MSGAYKIQKIVLHDFNNMNKQWAILYPKTSGDMVVGQVSDSKLFDGHPTEDFMPSTFSTYMRVVDKKTTSSGIKKVPQGLLAKEFIVAQNYDKMEDWVEANRGSTENSIWVKDKVYVENGKKELSTVEYVDDVHGQLLGSGPITQTGEIYNHLVHHSEVADKLTKSVLINGINFDGSKNIDIPFCYISNTPPTNTKLLWIKEDTHTICYYDGLKSAWVPTTSVWSEDANKKWNSSLNVFM